MYIDFCEQHEKQKGRHLSQRWLELKFEVKEKWWNGVRTKLAVLETTSASTSITHLNIRLYCQLAS